MLERIVRNTAAACVLMAVGFAAWRRDLLSGVSVLGGGALIGLSYWAIAGTVDALIALRIGLFRGSEEAATADLSRHSGEPATADLLRHSGEAATADETPPKPPGLQLVKFFTRHGMLALAAYGMMVRLHLDPVGLLAGVSSLVIAVAVEVLRDSRWRRFP